MNKMTNGDRIRLLADEKLANLLQHSCPVSRCPDPPPHDCYNCWLNWLKQKDTCNMEKVVHCKDCIYWNGNDCTVYYGLSSPRPNDFCSRGEALEVPKNG